MTNRRLRLALFATILAGLAVASARAQTLSGAGARDCRAFTTAVENEVTAAIDSYLSWSQGYISGINLANRNGLDTAIDHANLFHWLTTYCRATPEAAIYQALNELTGFRPAE